MEDDGDPHGYGEPGVVVRHVVPCRGYVRLHRVVETRVSHRVQEAV